MWKIFILVLTALLLFNCGEKSLPSIHIIKPDDIPWDKKEPCEIIFDDGNKVSNLKGQIKCRGGMSSKYHKRSFTIELDEKFQFLELPKDDDWVINASYIDKTLMRHKINYDLYRQMNPENISPKSIYVKTYLNDNYEGIYLIMEKINAGMLDLNKKDSSAMVFKDPPVFRKEKLSFVADSTNYYEQKYPDIKKIDKSYYLDSFRTFLFNSTDREFDNNISSWIDVENLIDWQLLLMFSNNGDGILKNFYLYKKSENEPFRIAIWDCDHSFGRDGDNELNLIDNELDLEKSILFDRLMTGYSGIHYFQKLKKRWFELRELNIFSIQNFEKLIQENHQEIKNDVDDNFERWPIDGKWYFDNNDYHQELNLMKKFVKLRLNQLDDYFMSI